MKRVGWGDALIVLLAMSALVSFARDRAIDSQALPPLALGQRIEVNVTGPGLVGPTPISDVASGVCRYVIVANRTCPNCSALARAWTTTALNSASGASVPPNWVTFWIVVDDGEVDGALADPAFPVDQFWANGSAHSELLKAGVIAVPFHVVLNEDGLILHGEVGGELAPYASFEEGCYIDEDDINDAGVTVIAGS